MDQAALQRVTLVRTSGTLCWTAWGAREQQSLRTWILFLFWCFSEFPGWPIGLLCCNALQVLCWDEDTLGAPEQFCSYFSAWRLCDNAWLMKVYSYGKHVIRHNDEVLTMLDSAWDVLPSTWHGSHVHSETFFRPTPSWLSPGRYIRSTAGKRWIVNFMQGRLSVDSLKSAGNRPIHSPVSNPIKHKATKKGKQTNKTRQNTTTPKTNKTQRSGISTSSEKWDARWHLVYHHEYGQKKKQNKDNPEKHKGPYKRVKEATKLNAETGDPPARIPQRSQRAAIPA